MPDQTYRGLLERARTALALDASTVVESNIKGRLEVLASELVLEWLTGDKRYESQSQQTEYWLSRFYEELFVDEQPDATRIYQRFGMSLPRAGYFARLLRARRAAKWREDARTELKTELKRYEARAKGERDAKPTRGHITEFDVSLSPSAADELRVQYDRIARFEPKHERPKPPKVKASFGNSRSLAIVANTLLDILEKLDRGGGP